MAGNITSVFADGTLTLTGDTDDNVFILKGTGPGSVQVLGNETTIDGVMSKTFTGVTNILFLDEGGSDTIFGSGLNLAGSLTLSTDPMGSAGDDTIKLIDINLGSDLTIQADPRNDNYTHSPTGIVNSSAGADVVVLSQIVVGDDAIVVTGDTGGLTGIKDDVVTILDLKANNADRDYFPSQFLTGVGSDSISMSNVTINDNLYLNSDSDQGTTKLSGSDTVAVTNIRIIGTIYARTDGRPAGVGNGNDTLSMVNVDSGQLVLSTGGGNDAVTINNSRFGVLLTRPGTLANLIDVGAATGLDKDSVVVTRSTFYGGVNLTTGADNDYVNISSSTFTGPAGVNTQINLGAGNDVIHVGANTFDSVASTNLIGGTGINSFYASGNRTRTGAKLVFPNRGGFTVFVSV